MKEKSGTETSTTSGKSMFSNEVVSERNNKVLYEALVKTMEDAKCEMETALFHGQFQQKWHCRIMPDILQTN